MNRIKTMTGRELAQYLGQDATDAQGDGMKVLLVVCGYGGYTPGDVPYPIWDAAARAMVAA